MDIALANEARNAANALTVFKRFRARYLGKKLYLGHEQRAGWTAPIPLYLFWCQVCGRFAKDYPHGYPHRQYLVCSSCNAFYSFVPLRISWRRFVELLRFACRHRMKKRP